MCIYCLLIYESDSVTREAAAVWCKWTSSRKIGRKIKSCHIFTRSICGNQAAGKAEEDEDAEEVVNPVPISFAQPRRSSWSFWATFSSSDSMAARLSISGSWRRNERRGSKEKRLRRRDGENANNDILYKCKRFMHKTALKKEPNIISFHSLLLWQ